MPDLLTLSAAPYSATESSDLAGIVLRGLDLSQREMSRKDALAQAAFENFMTTMKFNADQTMKQAEMGFKERELNRLEDNQAFQQMLDMAKFGEAQKEFDITSKQNDRRLSIDDRNVSVSERRQTLSEQQWGDPNEEAARRTAAEKAAFDLDQQKKWGDTISSLKISEAAANAEKDRADAARINDEIANPDKYHSSRSGGMTPYQTSQFFLDQKKSAADTVDRLEKEIAGLSIDPKWNAIQTQKERDEYKKRLTDKLESAKELHDQWTDKANKMSGYFLSNAGISDTLADKQADLITKKPQANRTPSFADWGMRADSGAPVSGISGAPTPKSGAGITNPVAPSDISGFYSAPPKIEGDWTLGK